VINFQADRHELLKRLTGRRVCSNCGTSYHVHYSPPARPDTCDKCGGHVIQRSDDNEESVSRRLENFERTVRPLLDYYAERQLLVTINASGQIYDVQERVKKALSP
jgi:adenylate kinase